MWFLVLGCHSTTPFSGALGGKTSFFSVDLRFKLYSLTVSTVPIKPVKMYSLKINYYYYYYNKLLPEVLSGSIILEDKGLSLCLKDT